MNRETNPQKLLLHICCGPCSLSVIDTLTEEFGAGVPISGFFFNPNLFPYGEWIRRSKSAEIACETKGIPLLIRPGYEMAAWKTFSGDAKSRCEMCYRRRFEETAAYAAAHGYSHFTSTLFVSPYQHHDLMRWVAEKSAEKFGVSFLYRDFRPGFYTGQAQARALGLYRQKYCGCIRSLRGE